MYVQKFPLNFSPSRGGCAPITVFNPTSVPWLLRKLLLGNLVPEGFCLGGPLRLRLAHRVGSTEERDRQYGYARKWKQPRGDDDDTLMVINSVLPTKGDDREEDVQVYTSTQPSYNCWSTSHGPVRHCVVAARAHPDRLQKLWKSR